MYKEFHKDTVYVAAYLCVRTHMSKRQTATGVNLQIPNRCEDLKSVNSEHLGVNIVDALHFLPLSCYRTNLLRDRQWADWSMCEASKTDI